MGWFRRRTVTSARAGRVDWAVPFTDPAIGDPYGTPMLFADGSVGVWVRYAGDDRLVLHTQAVADQFDPVGKPCRAFVPTVRFEGGRSWWGGVREEDPWGIYGVEVDGIVVSATPAGRNRWEIVALDPDGDAKPHRLVDAVTRLGFHVGPMSGDGLEAHWLAENCRALGARPPAGTDVEDLLAGLASLWSVPVDDVVGWDGFDPTPTVERGWLRWSLPAPPEVPVPLVLTHMVTGRNQPGRGVAEIVMSGALLSAWRRRIAGIDDGGDIDRIAGLSTQVFFHVEARPPMRATQMVWSDPHRLFHRLGWLWLPQDPAPTLIPGDPRVDVDWRAWAVADPRRVGPTPASQVAYDAGIDLVGADGPDLILVPNDAERRNVLAAASAAGIATIGGFDPADVVIVDGR